MKKKKFFLLSLSHYYLIHTSTYLLTYLLTPTDDHIIKVIQQTIFYIVFVKTPQQQHITSVVKDLLISILPPPLSFPLSFLSFHFYPFLSFDDFALCETKQNKSKNKNKTKSTQKTKDFFTLCHWGKKRDTEFMEGI